MIVKLYYKIKYYYLFKKEVKRVKKIMQKAELMIWADSTLMQSDKN